MRMVADDTSFESSVCDVRRMSAALSQLLIDLQERYDAEKVPKDFMDDLECATLVATTLYDMTVALKQEFYADLKAKHAPRGTIGRPKLVK